MFLREISDCSQRHQQIFFVFLFFFCLTGRLSGKTKCQRLFHLLNCSISVNIFWKDRVKYLIPASSSQNTEFRYFDLMRRRRRRLGDTRSNKTTTLQHDGCLFRHNVNFMTYMFAVGSHSTLPTSPRHTVQDGGRGYPRSCSPA